MEKRLVDLTKTDVLEDGDYLFVNHGDNPVQVSFPFIKEQIAPNDTTLSESGKFADAKVVGDKLNEHSQSIETINTEIEAIKADYATKEEAETKTHAEETFATKASLSSLQEDLNGVKEDYLTKQEDQENRDTEFYEGRKYNGMTYAGKTSDKGVQLHSVKGKTVQQTTNGYQLFDSSKLATKSQGGATVTNNGDGSFTISGSGNLTEKHVANYRVSNEDIVKLLKVGTLKLLNNDTVPNLVINFVVNGTHVSGLGEPNNSFEITQNMLNDPTFEMVVYMFGQQGSQIKTGTIKPMLYQDGDGTWEPYTGGKPAPNPDYPMEIQNVEIDKVFSSSGNILNLNWNWEHNKVDYTITNDRTIKAFVTNKIGYPMLSHVFNDNELEFIKGKYITPLLDKKESSKTTSIFQIYYKNPNGSYYINPSNGKQFIPKNITQFVVQLVIVNSDDLDAIEVGDYATFTAPRIIVGDTEDTSWRPYGFSAIETSLTLAEGDTYENGQITRTRKQVVFDGSSDEAWMLQSINDYRIANFHITMNGFTSETKVVCDRLTESKELISIATKEGYFVSRYTLYIRLKQEIASTVENFKTWLSTHPLTVEYELVTPITEELKIPTVPSYFPYTEVSTDNTLETDITWKILADCDNSLKQEALEQRILALETKAIE